MVSIFTWAGNAVLEFLRDLHAASLCAAAVERQASPAPAALRRLGIDPGAFQRINRA